MSIPLFLLQRLGKTVSKEIVFYLEEQLLSLQVQIGEFHASFWDAMKHGRLIGYCYQATEVASLFLMNASICRGKVLSCDHAWISFDYQGESYIFDPALNLISKEDLYHFFLESEVAVKIPTSFVQRDFLLYHTRQKEEFIPELKLDRLLQLPTSAIYILGSEDACDAFYRTYSALDAEMENHKVKSLRAHFDSKK